MSYSGSCGGVTFGKQGCILILIGTKKLTQILKLGIKSNQCL
jgi:hypothetical protein